MSNYSFNSILVSAGQIKRDSRWQRGKQGAEVTVAEGKLTKRFTGGIYLFIYFLFYFIIHLLLEYNCFTMLC